jgi:hypothetical protein
MLRQIIFKVMVLTAVPAATVGIALAQSNIDNTVPDKYGWGENVGWTNWRDANSAVDGVNVGAFVLRGYIWGENIGWINVGDGTPTSPPYYANANGTDFGVNIDADGDLHGYAWGENIGWINFDGGAMATPAQPARIICASPPGQPLARLTGYAWGENVGWINLSDLTAGKFVAVDAATTPILCDVNHDGAKNGRDVQFFVSILLTGGASWRDVCSGDQPPTNGAIDLGDVDPFVTCLLTAP